MKPHPAWSALPVPFHANKQETPLRGVSSARSHGSASPPNSHPDPLTRASFPPSPPSLLFPVPPSHPERCSPTALSRTEPPSVPSHQQHQSVSPLSPPAGARMCHAASSYPDCTPSPSSSTVTMAHSLPSQGVSTLAEPCTTGGTCQRAMVAPLFCDQ